MVTRTKKIFVGGLSVNTTVEDVKQYFEQFGKVGLNSVQGRCFLGL
jgi:RNA-binding protein Musashi